MVYFSPQVPKGPWEAWLTPWFWGRWPKSPDMGKSLKLVPTSILGRHLLVTSPTVSYSTRKHSMFYIQTCSMMQVVEMDMPGLWWEQTMCFNGWSSELISGILDSKKETQSRCSALIVSSLTPKATCHLLCAVTHLEISGCCGCTKRTPQLTRWRTERHYLRRGEIASSHHRPHGHRTMPP